MNSASAGVRPGNQRFIDSIFEVLPPTRRNPDPRKTIRPLSGVWSSRRFVMWDPVLGDIWLHFLDGQCVAHCSVWGSDIKLPVLCGRTPATLHDSESEICAAT